LDTVHSQPNHLYRSGVVKLGFCLAYWAISQIPVEKGPFFIYFQLHVPHFPPDNTLQVIRRSEYLTRYVFGFNSLLM